MNEWDAHNPYKTIDWSQQDDLNMDVDPPEEGKGKPGLPEDPTPGPVVTMDHTPSPQPVQPMTPADLKLIHSLQKAQALQAEQALLGSLHQYKPPPPREYVQIKRRSNNPMVAQTPRPSPYK